MSKSILIVGAGPVGLAAAVELTRRGFEPRIVDAGAGPTPAEQSRALGVLPRTLEILTPSGVAERMIAEGLKIDRVQIARAGRRLFTLRTKAARTPHPYFLSLPQGRTEQLMIDWLAGQRIEIAWNHQLVALEEQGERSVATFANGNCMAADIVIGCDGVHSAVRSLSGIGWSGEGYPASFALADVRFTRPIDPHLAQGDLHGRSGAAVRIPLSENVVRYVGTASSTEALLAGVSGIEEIVWASQFRISFRRAEKFTAGQRYLAGDSAHVHSPVGGRGMNLGIWDAATLAFLLSTDRESEYETSRLSLADEIIRSTRRATDAIRSRTVPVDLVLRIIAPFLMPVAARLPFVERRIVERFLALDLPRPEWL